MPARWLRSVLLTLSLVGLAACGGDPGSTVESSGAPTSSSAEPTGTTSPPPPLSTDEQAVADAALAAYNGAWGILVLSQRDPGAKSDWSLDYRQYYTDPELTTALGQVYGMRDAGLASPTGEPNRNPQAVAVNLEAQSVDVRDCVDLAPWPQVYVATGESNSLPQEPFVVLARVVYDELVARWLVAEQTPQADQPC